MKIFKDKEDLSIYQIAKPLFDKPLYVGCPNIGDRELFFSLADQILDRNWLTNSGPCVKELEKQLSEYLGVRHAILTCNATIGLELAARALGMNHNVIVPSFTFIATAHMLKWQECKPVFADIDEATHNIDPQDVEGLMTSSTTGIVGVHVWGRPCDIDALEAISQKHHIPLLFDSAHAFGCSYKQKMIGGFGNCEVFSLHATKVYNTFEGGLITTNDDDLAERLRLMLNFGFRGYDNVIGVGINGKMTEICAAIGIVNLKKLPDFISANKTVYEAYQLGLKNIPGIRMIGFDENEKNNYQYIVLEIDEDVFGMSRDRLNDILHAENIISRRYFYPGCHRSEPYSSEKLKLPHTDILSENVLVLPAGQQLTADAVGEICLLIDFIHRKQGN